MSVVVHDNLLFLATADYPNTDLGSIGVVRIGYKFGHGVGKP